jgi:hypothetical protein
MTAIEALLELQKRDPNAASLVDEFVSLVKRAPLDAETKNSMRGSLNWLRFESIGQAGKRMTRELLGTTIYDGRIAEKYFSYCYHLRSTIVHEGKTKKVAELVVEANNLQQFVGDLIQASVGITRAPASRQSPSGKRSPIALIGVTVRGHLLRIKKGLSKLARRIENRG